MTISERIPAAFRDSKPTNLDEIKSPAQRIHEALLEFREGNVLGGIHELANELQPDPNSPQALVIELYVPIRPDTVYSSIVLRDKPEPIRYLYGDRQEVRQLNGFLMWKSRGVKVAEGKDMLPVVGYMKAKTGYEKGEEREWKLLSEHEKAGLSIGEQIKKAFELSTASHDDRMGTDVDHLTGRSDNNAGFLTKIVTINEDLTIVLTDPSTK